MKGGNIIKKNAELLKKQKARLLIVATCAAIMLTSGCAKSSDDSKSNNYGYYVITYNMDNAVIFELDNGYCNEYGISDTINDYKANFRVYGQSIVIKNENENSKEYVYSVAQSLVGEDGSVTFYDADEQLKLKK